MKGKTEDPSLQLALAAADLADDGKAIGITILDLREVSSVADYFVIASGRSHIQVEAICDRIAEGVRDRLDRRPIAVEGLEQALWGILDYGSVVVHAFQESVRELYDLERLWSLAPRWKHGDALPSAKGTATPAPSAKAATKTKKAAAKTTAKPKTTATTKATAKASPKAASKSSSRSSSKPSPKPASTAADKPAGAKAKRAVTAKAPKPATPAKPSKEAKPAAAKKPAAKAAATTRKPARKPASSED